MKRLTGRAPDGTAYLYNMGGTNAAIDRLAAYEDTGLEPEEISIRRWIPVMERVPEELEDVLCCTDEGYIVLGWLVENPKMTTTGYECASSDGFVRNITHWMPLPEPPEEVTQNA